MDPNNDNTLILGELEESNSLMLSEISIDQNLNRHQTEQQVFEQSSQISNAFNNTLKNPILRAPSLVIKKTQIKFKPSPKNL